MIASFQSRLWLVLGALSFLIRVLGEQHRVRFDNRCGYGTPHLLKDGKVLSQGEEFVSNGSFTSGIAYLQTGNCNLNGEGCTLVEMTLINPACPGCGSSVDISLIPPLAYSVPTSFSYFNGCDGHGAACSSPDCVHAFFAPGDNNVQVQCEEHDVDLLISFCPGSSISTPTVTTANVMSLTNKPRPTVLSSPPKAHVVQSDATGTEVGDMMETPGIKPSDLPSGTTSRKRRCNKAHPKHRDLVRHSRNIYQHRHKKHV